jgi:hypothetical protein
MANTDISQKAGVTRKALLYCSRAKSTATGGRSCRLDRFIVRKGWAETHATSDEEFGGIERKKITMFKEASDKGWGLNVVSTKFSRQYISYMHTGAMRWEMIACRRVSFRWTPRLH